MSLLKLPRAERLNAIKKIMEVARGHGLYGMGGECGSLAVAMRRVMFGEAAEITAGLNQAFEEKNILIGHFVVTVPDEEFECLHFDEQGVPLANDNITSWGMLDSQDTDWKERAIDAGFILTNEASENTVLLVFDDEQDVLKNMGGSGVKDKARILTDSMRELGFGDFIAENYGKKISPNN
jgi:hypothetical protein